jgi:hypothetical protein
MIILFNDYIQIPLYSDESEISEDRFNYNEIFISILNEIQENKNDDPEIQIYKSEIIPDIRSKDDQFI